MSSDSDEDELLQLALKEQAQRDVNYHRPSSNARKPVANFVQPPKPSNPPPLSSGIRQVPAQQNVTGNRRSLDMDDESEVEMLSISSGEEDADKDFDDKRKPATRNGVSRALEDKMWDGEEPDNWKRVDEAELSRRVREMRESRTAPVAQKFEKKNSVVIRKALNNLQSFPRGMECVDPLGLGVIDNRTLKLITDSSESSPSVSDGDQHDSGLREKMLYLSENFEAQLFLSRIHQDTSASDLEAGAKSLKSDLKGRTQQRKQLVKENFDCFVSCKTTIDDIESKLKRIEDDPESSGTTNLFNLMQRVGSLANRALEPLFERQTQAEKIRSVQGMLQRYRTLFNLPSTIRSSISKGEYDMAIREYKKAKSVSLPSSVNILKRVLEEVEKVMQEFKGTLYNSLEDPPIDLANLENTVRLLLELEPDSDPVWHYLKVQISKVRGLLEKCTIDHEVRMEALHNEMKEKQLADAKWKKIQESLNPSAYMSVADIQIEAEPSQIVLIGEETDKLRLKYIKRLTSVIIFHIPAFWKISVSVFSGKFAKSSQISSDSNVNSTANKSDDKFDDEKYSKHSLDEVAQMIQSTMSAYESKIHSTFRDLEETNILRSFMSDSINEIGKAIQSFEVKDAAPLSAIVAIRSLQTEIVKIYILRLCSWMRATTEDISTKETWVPASVLERNKSPYLISYSPLNFHSVVTSAMDQISLMNKALLSEAEKTTEDNYAQLYEIQESVRLAFLNCFLDFAGNLENIASELPENRLSRMHSTVLNGSYEQEEDSSSDPETVVNLHQRLLMVLSNIGYCKDELSHQLYNKYKTIWLHSRTKDDGDDIQDLVMSFSALEEKVLSQYTLAKANLMRKAVVDYLLNSGVQWATAPVVRGVRDAAVDLLHTLVAVHAEVFSGAKPLLDKTLSILVEGLIDTLLSVFHESQSKELGTLDSNGFCQLMLELDYLETILNQYFTPAARESLKSLQRVLLERATENAAEPVENPGHQRRPTRGSEDVNSDDRSVGAFPDDLIAMAQQCTSELLQAELERTRVNTACFAESTPLDSVPESAKAAYSFTDSMDFRGKTFQADSPSFSFRRLR